MPACSRSWTVTARAELKLRFSHVRPRTRWGDITDTALYGCSRDVRLPGGNTGQDADPVPIEWDDEALVRMERIPPFVRGMVKRRREQFARGRGKSRITAGMLDDAKSKAAAFLDRRGMPDP